jgi:hypothetical protein
MPEQTTLDHTSPDFHPLDHSQLNDLRRRVVKNDEVTPDELKHAIQTLLYEEREKDLKLAAKVKKTPRPKAEPLDPSVNFDDLLDKPVV